LGGCGPQHGTTVTCGDTVQNKQNKGLLKSGTKQRCAENIAVVNSTSRCRLKLLPGLFSVLFGLSSGKSFCFPGAWANYLVEASWALEDIMPSQMPNESRWIQMPSQMACCGCARFLCTNASLAHSWGTCWAAAVPPSLIPSLLFDHLLAHLLILGHVTSFLGI
jgi:hypothetical protein